MNHVRQESRSLCFTLTNLISHATYGKGKNQRG